VRSPLVAHDVKGDLIGQVIRNGRPDKGMPAFHLTDELISDIAAYLHDRIRQVKASGFYLPDSYPLKRLLTGKAEAGRAFFNGEGGCTSCHSPAGDLAHVAEKYPPIILASRMLYPAGVPSTVTVTLPSGEQIKGQLVHVDEFVVALRDSSGWYHSFPRNRAKEVQVHDPLVAHRELLSKLSQADFHNLFAFLATLK
jgi:cytochrome c oxidase cbb3-type subunit 3